MLIHCAILDRHRHEGDSLIQMGSASSSPVSQATPLVANCADSRQSKYRIKTRLPAISGSLFVGTETAA